MLVTLPLPPAEPLALAGMGLVGLFGLWKLHVVPRLQRRRSAALA